uniref:SJCHGC09299 protein n=1 Tax=Schistosoma japonicum TaxID=6182 RepID=Q5DHX3_SCHJA|nr:SJCHGC09299 protein [Schistosoma japonicum]
MRQIQISATLEGGNLTMLPPHTETIHCVKLSADGHYLVTGSQDQTARIWTMPDERLLHTLEGHADDVLSVAISLDSEVVVTGSWDGSIRVWRVRDGNQMCWFTSNIEILQVKISNDKRALVALGERSGHRKLIMLQVLRNRTRTTTNLRTAGSRITSSLSPPTPGYSPSSPVVMA